MDPITIGLILQILIKYGPDVAEAAKAILTKATPPTEEEWMMLFTKAREKTYDDYVKPTGGGA